MRFTSLYSRLERIALGVATLSLLFLVGAAQDAKCLSGWEWSYNSLGQDPCEIVIFTYCNCLGYICVIVPLTASDVPYYAPPQANNTDQKRCGCNTVTYSLLAACAACQFNYSKATPSWAYWSEPCDNTSVTQYPFPIHSNTSIPHWAFLDDTNPSFNVTLAKAAGRDPEATSSNPSPSTVPPSSTDTPQTSTPMTPTSGTGTPPAPSSTTNEDSGHTKSNNGPIAGGVVGGVVGLAALSALAFFFKRRGTSGGRNTILKENQMTNNPTSDGQWHEPPRLYNPSDPSTFPHALLGSDASSLDVYPTRVSQGGSYRGVAEL